MSRFGFLPGSSPGDMAEFTEVLANLEGLGPRFTCGIVVPPTAFDTPPAHIEVVALIDTGATRSVMKVGLAQRLRLRPVGRSTLTTANGQTVPTYEYYVQFRLPQGIIVESVPFEAKLADDQVQLLIGRDVLAKGTFHYSGRDNWFTFTL